MGHILKLDIAKQTKILYIWHILLGYNYISPKRVFAFVGKIEEKKNQAENIIYVFAILEIGVTSSEHVFANGARRRI